MNSPPLRIARLWELSQSSYSRLLQRSRGDVEKVLPEVRKIVSEVCGRGDEAVLEYTREFDEVDLTAEQLRVRDEEIKKSRREMDDEDIEALKKAAISIERYHRRQVPEDWMEELAPGIQAGQIVRPLNSVGVYIPGGVAQYPSTVLMTVIPAKVAGVERVLISTPPSSAGGVNPATLASADIAGGDEVYRIGGAQSIAAMAYGTQTVSSVEKIVGPGNIYVAGAKRLVSSDVEVDFEAGPTEVLILADSSTDPHLAALDMVAQAEHDPLSSAVLVTSSEGVGEEVKDEIKALLRETARREIISEALEKNGQVVITRSLEKAIEFSNDYAPEHLQLMVKEPIKVLEKVKNAGAVLLGSYSPTAAGDFAVGPSHVLPTGGEARRVSGLSVSSFLKMPSVQRLTKEGLEEIADLVERLAELEGLPAHAMSVKERLGG